MNQKKSTKRTLITSALSLVLCMAMLIGTTFAWFTDSVTSTNNIIKSGTLDVALEYKEMDETEYKDASQGAIFDYDLWEPGYVQVKHVRISNKGTLALKYQLNIIANIEATAGKANLADVIDVYMVDGAETVTRAEIAEATPVGTLSSLMADADGAAYGFLSANTDKEVTIALKMQESAGNEYQNLSVGDGFAVQLLATQYTEETDSFDNQYDKDAEYPNVVFKVVDLVNELGAGDDVILANSLTFNANDTTANSGYGKTGVSVKGGILDGNGNTVTVKDANSTWDCAIHTTGGTIKNVVVAGAMRGIFMGSATDDVYIDNVIFDDVIYTFNSDGGNKQYGVYISNSTLNGWTSFSNAHKEVVFDNCRFGEGSGYAFCRPYQAVTFKDCAFEEGYRLDISQTTGIVLDNCTIGGVVVTAKNIQDLIDNDPALVSTNVTIK